MRAPGRSYLLLLYLLAAVSASAAQSPTPRARPLPASAVAGAVVSIDTDTATIRLKTKSGAETTYRYTEKTLMLRGKKTVEIGGFQPGDSVVARSRKTSVGPATLYDLADPASFSWLDRLRHETTAVTIRLLEEGWLHVSEGADAAEFSYRVTDKTAWWKAGEGATQSDFKKGDRVHVVPRLLPAGSTMAVAVSDAPDAAARLKERSRPTLAARIKSVDASTRRVTVLSAAGDERVLALTPDCSIRQGGKDVPITALKPRQTVTLHLTRDETGEQVVRRITIKAKPSTVKPKPMPDKLPRRPYTGL